MYGRRLPIRQSRLEQSKAALPCHILHGGKSPRDTDNATNLRVVLSEAVGDLGRMTVGTNNVETDPRAMEHVGVLHELAIEPGSAPHRATVHAVASWAVIEYREDIADALRSDMEYTLLRCHGETRQTSEEKGGDFDEKDTDGYTYS